MSAPPFDPAVESYYDGQPEEDRLATGVSRIEAERTRSIVRRFLDPPPGVVVDVGGGSGPHAFWLSHLGYDVHLVDPSARLVGLAREENAGSARPLKSVEVGDARALPFADASVDAALLFGPLYHLTERTDRVSALEEAARVLRPGGLLFTACITRWASLMDGLAFDHLADPAFAGIVAEDLRTGQHRNPSEHPGYFTTAYFHRPEELASEVEDAGFALEALLGVEGPARLLADFDARWSDPRRRRDLTRAAEAIEDEPSLLGLSPHLIAVGRR